MNEQLTEESLGIFWEGEEVDGIMAYGLWKGAIVAEPLFPRAAWPPETKCRPHHLLGDGWTILLWNIRIEKWPSPKAWEGTLRNTLSCFHDQGALVGWCGLEGRFVEPPALFEPDEMGEGVYVASTADGWFKCAAQLSSRFAVLPDEDLRSLNDKVRQILQT